MKDCDNIIECICDYIDNHMSKEQCEIFKKHLKQCKDCKQLVDDMKKIKELCKKGKTIIPDEIKIRLNDFLNKQIK